MKKYTMIFRQGDAGGGGGGEGGGGDNAGGADSAGAAIFTPPAKMGGEKPLPMEKMEKQVSAQDPQKPEAGAGTSSAPTAGFDPSKFAAEFGKSVAESLKPVVNKAPEMSPEEARKLLNMWEPDDNWYRKYDNLDTRGEAVMEMRDALVRQADTLAQLRMQELFDSFRKEIMPQLSMVEEQTNRQREERFHGSFPQLKHPGLQPLISAVTEDLVKQGKTFTSESEMFKAVADGVAAVIKVSNPDFKLETTAGQNPASRNPNAIPVTTPGSGGGGADNSGAPAKGSPKRGLAVFE